MAFASVIAFTIGSMVTFSSIDAFDHGIFPFKISFGNETPTLLESFSTIGSNGHSVRFYMMF